MKLFRGSSNRKIIWGSVGLFCLGFLLYAKLKQRNVNFNFWQQSYLQRRREQKKQFLKTGGCYYEDINGSSKFKLPMERNGKEKNMAIKNDNSPKSGISNSSLKIPYSNISISNNTESPSIPTTDYNSPEMLTSLHSNKSADAHFNDEIWCVNKIKLIFLLQKRDDLPRLLNKCCEEMTSAYIGLFVDCLKNIVRTKQAGSNYLLLKDVLKEKCLFLYLVIESMTDFKATEFDLNFLAEIVKGLTRIMEIVGG